MHLWHWFSFVLPFGLWYVYGYAPHLKLMQFIELFDVRLSMLGPHQLQNAATATCASLCLRDQGADLGFYIHFM